MMFYLIFGAFLIIIGLYWFYTVTVLKNLATIFPCHESEIGDTDDSSIVVIIQRIIPASFRYSIQICITSNSLCLNPTGAWGWLPSVAIPREKLTIRKYQTKKFPVIELTIHNSDTRLIMRGDGAPLIRNAVEATAARNH
jgi:hypothetical protein